MKTDGYAFTPLPPRPRRVPRSNARFDRRLPGMLFGRLTLTYRVEQPVHVGAGHKLIVDGKPVRAQVRRGADAIVPGSSWKVATRARFEAITLACAGEAPKGRGQIRSQTYDGYSANLAAQVQRHPIFASCCTDAGDVTPQVCPACALFGLMNRRSRVSFGDLVSGTPVEMAYMAQQFEPRLHHLAEPRDVEVDRNRRSLTVRRLRGRKFHGGKSPRPKKALMQVEAIPVGTLLTGQVRIFNLSEAEFGGLLMALGFPRYSFLKLGGGKPVGFGRVRPDAHELDLRTHLNQPVRRDAMAWEPAFLASEDHWSEGSRALLAIHRRRDW